MQSMPAFIAAGVILATAYGVAVLASQNPQPPVFRSGAELILIETTVAGRDGTPVRDLAPGEFEVFIDGRRRRVVSADFIDVAGPASGGTTSPTAATVPAAPAPEGRTIVIAVDEHSVPLAARVSAQEAVRQILAGVQPADLLGLMAFPGPLAVGPTRDVEQVLAAVPQIAGRRVDLPRSRFGLTAADAITIRSRDAVGMADIIARACRLDAINSSCAQEVRETGAMMADALEHQGMATIDGIHGLFDTLRILPGRKTLFLISAGLPTTNRPGGRPNLSAATEEIARRAASANVHLYVLYLNVHFLQHFSVANNYRSPSTLYEDISLFGAGLERFAASAGGAFFQIEVDADPFVARALRETSGMYVVAVAPEPADRDGKEHRIRVTTSRRGVVLRHRQVAVIPTGR